MWVGPSRHEQVADHQEDDETRECQPDRTPGRGTPDEIEVHPARQHTGTVRPLNRTAMDSVSLRMHNSLIRRISAVVAVAGLALSFSACSSSGSKGAKSSSSDITIANFAFKTSSVKAGSTVTVTNNDTTTHTVTSNDGKSFNVTVDAGKTVTFTAPAAGTYDFHCNIHKTMTSKLTV